MSVRFQHHDALEINRIDYGGALSADEFYAHAHFRLAQPQWLNYDHINVILPDADASALTRGVLDALFLKHQALFDTHKLLIMRRSAWICQSPGARPLLDYWLSDQDKTRAAHTEVRLFETFEAAGEWLVLTPPQSALVARGEGFREIARFEAP